MAKYFYLPSPDDELCGMVQHWNENRQDGDQYVVLKHGASTEYPLRQVKPADRLYVFGHGNMGKGIGPTDHGLNEDQLAQRIKDDLLPEAHPEIRLFACNSAVKMPGQGAPYAKRFAKAMAKRGYHGIRVIGYIGFMTLPRSGTNKQGVLELKLDANKKVIDHSEFLAARGQKIVFSKTPGSPTTHSPNQAWFGVKSKGKDDDGTRTTLYQVCQVMNTNDQ